MSLGFCATCGSIVLNLPQISATEDLSSSFLDRAAGVKTSSNTAQPLACNAFEISEGNAFSTTPSSSGIPSLPFIPDFVMPTCGGRIKSLWTTTLPLFKSGCSNWPWARGETNASENRMDPKHETLAFIDPPPNYAPRPGVTSTHSRPQQDQGVGAGAFAALCFWAVSRRRICAWSVAFGASSRYLWNSTAHCAGSCSFSKRNPRPRCAAASEGLISTALR